MPPKALPIKMPHLALLSCSKYQADSKVRVSTGTWCLVDCLLDCSKGAPQLTTTQLAAHYLQHTNRLQQPKLLLLLLLVDPAMTPDQTDKHVRKANLVWQQCQLARQLAKYPSTFHHLWFVEAPLSGPSG
jgi:hypothetical protein